MARAPWQPEIQSEPEPEPGPESESELGMELELEPEPEPEQGMFQRTPEITSSEPPNDRGMERRRACLPAVCRYYVLPLAGRKPGGCLGGR